MNIKYIDYNEKYRDELCYMINQLYIEDPEGETMSSEKIEVTIEYAEKHPDALRVFMLVGEVSVSEGPIGYAIVQLTWSNEWGGLTANIDEMYIMQSARGRGVATDFINKVPELIPDVKRVTLEVTPSNKKAMKLYKRLGFSVAENSTMEKIAK